MNLKICLPILLLILVPASLAATTLPGRYCEGMGYEVINGTNGKEICVLPDGSKTAAEDFFSGEGKQQYNYCIVNGYKFKVIDDSRCPPGSNGHCVACITPGIIEVEQSQLMRENGDLPEPEKAVSSTTPKEAKKTKRNYAIFLFPLVFIFVLLLIYREINRRR